MMIERWSRNPWPILLLTVGATLLTWPLLLAFVAAEHSRVSRLLYPVNAGWFYIGPAVAASVLVLALVNASRRRTPVRIVTGFALTLIGLALLHLVTAAVATVPLYPMIDAYLNSSGAGTEYAGIGNLIGAPIVSFLVVVPAVVLVILIVGWMREAKRPGSVGVAAAASLVWLLLLSSVAFGFRGERSRDTSSSAQRHLTQVEQAIADNDLEGVRRAVRLGGGVKDSDLAASVSNDRIAIARFLVERGARDPDGIALKSAARLLYPDMVELILHADPSSVRAAFNDPDFYSTVTRDPWDAKNRVRIIDDMIATHAVVNPREMSATERRTLESFRAKSAAIHADIDRH